MRANDLAKWGAAAALLALVAACEPEVGSDEWCAGMEEKPKGEWTLNETAEFTKNCIIKMPKE
ncbi:MAG: DUF3012 domain-containing protein [Rhizobiales bacterium NRL2]|jgi:hypothetical protein|nr:MAG: DUF3012 domain-containing protein [Rhizobiales bacterium NRL2]